ncbi:alpha/beta-hydrolase [Mycena albidolilacea]|uniref:Alpha/beta-hydrolase n=1 Tax=Mycena albidolilacea TaxID=1033008 RepID=A0AAD6ZF31_9AGAR|nr:alpha/beta-hydrolase [Mycena albidolilacea]
MDDVTSHILHSSDSSIAGLGLTFKRYRPLATSVSKHSGATRVALVFAHCVGTHKETWMPVIEYLYQLQSSASCSVIIDEAWSMDSPNHGEAAAINEKALLERPQGITAYDWAKGVQTLLKSGLVSSDRVVSVGHSAGACVQVLSTISNSSEVLPYSSMILVEPTLMTKKILAEGFDQLSELTRIMDAVKKRRDIWESREIALVWFSKRLPWKRWDTRILDAFIQYGLRDLPTATYPDRTTGVTLSCTREQETVGYIYHQDGVDANERLKDICPRIPVHCVFGAEIDLVADETHRGVYEGRRMASITRIPNAGHLVTQEAPFKVAQHIWKALNHDYADEGKFKL